MKKRLKMDKNVNRNIVLCQTTSYHAGSATTKKLMEDSIPFTKSFKRIPFFKRDRYRGASEICVISINRNEYSKARRSIDRLDTRVRNRLVLNVI